MITLIAGAGQGSADSTLPGIIIPAAVFFISFFLAYRLYRHFSNPKDDTEQQ